MHPACRGVGARRDVLSAQEVAVGVDVLVVDAVDVDAMQDWSELAGSVLCRSCYVQYSKTGTLERIKQGPLAKSAKRCCYDGCKTPTESRQFLRIEGASQAGGQVFSLPHARVAFCRKVRGLAPQFWRKA